MAKKANRMFRINGRVIDRATQKGIVGLRVEAWDKDLIFHDLVGTAVTDVDGGFRIDLGESHFKELFQDRQPDLFFKVFREDELIKSTGDSVLWNVAAGSTEVVIEVAIPATAEPETLVVRGKVRDADGNLLIGIVVKAFDKDLRNDELLGEATTNKAGYEIRYSAHQFRRAEKGNADLLVKAYAAEGARPAASPVLFNAPLVANVDLTIPAEVLLPPTLFEKLGPALEPLLEGLKVEELEEDKVEELEKDKAHHDLSFLSGETGFEKNVLARFVLAHKLAEQGIQGEFWFALLGGSFYEYTEDNSLSEQLAPVLDALPSLDGAAVRKALIRSFNQKEIPAAFQENVAGWVEAFLVFVARRSVSESAEPTLVKSALEHAGITGAKKQETFARLFNEHKTLTPELLEALGKDRSFKKAEIADLSTSLQLVELTRGDFSVVKMLKEEFDVRQPEKIRTLAKKSASEWVNLVKEKLAAGDIKLPVEMGEIAGQIKIPEAEIYGKTLERQFREAFPTTAFAGGLERALHNGGAQGLPGLPHAEMMGKFLDGHENFELLNTSVDDFLKNKIAPDFRTLAEDEDFKLEVKAVQRVFKLAPTFEATHAMLADGVHSAQMAYRMGESEFVRSYGDRPGFTAETARVAWNRAADTYAGVLTIFGGLMALENGTQPRTLPSIDVVSSFPNWNNLFKTGDLCECEHCRSVLGPAAYFADMLVFLKDRNQLKPDGAKYTVKDILFARRPDLGYLELNCANALTALPYIDVVCEVLENAVDVTRANDLELTGFTAVPAVVATTAVAKALQGAFADPVNKNKEKIELGDNFSLSQVKPTDPDRWVVHGDNVTYLLKKKATPPGNFFAEILRNTKANAAELRAYPQYVNPKAYEKLRAAKYPLSLPFDLFAEDVRAAFQKTNLQRWDLMRTLRGGAAPNNPSVLDIACEYFGISTAPTPTAASDEQSLILKEDTTDPGQQVVWGVTGLTGASWLNTVGNVKTFLQKTGLEYNELLALLDLKFIDPDGDIEVDHSDDFSCDTDTKFIRVLDAEKLDRIHRFLRLWRKLKSWKMWELDLVVRHPRIGAIGNPKGALDRLFLLNLFYFSQLRKRLGGKTSVEQVCALFGDLNTETRFTKLHEKREDALYQNLFLNKRLVNPLDPAFQLHPGTGDLPAGDTITTHHAVMLAALSIREAELVLLKKLTKASDGTPYITDDLTLSNVSFLWRHAWLSKLLKFKAEDWKTILKVFQQDILYFDTPWAAWEFVERIDHLMAAGYTPDELNWLLTADRSAKAATKETDATKFSFELRKALQAIRGEYDASKYEFLTASPPTDEEQLAGLLTTLLQKLNRDETAVNFFLATVRGDVSVATKVTGVGALVFPAGIPIKYDTTSQTLRFTGVMTSAQKTALSGLSTAPSYLPAITELFDRPRLAVKFYETVFTAPLKILPPAVDFKAQLPAKLATKISYDAEQRLLRFNGIMTKSEQMALDALAPSVTPIQIAYHNAIASLLSQPLTPPANKLIC